MCAIAVILAVGQILKLIRRLPTNLVPPCLRQYLQGHCIVSLCLENSCDSIKLDLLHLSLLPSELKIRTEENSVPRVNLHLDAGCLRNVVVLQVNGWCLMTAESGNIIHLPCELEVPLCAKNKLKSIIYDPGAQSSLLVGQRDSFECKLNLSLESGWDDGESIVIPDDGIEQDDAKPSTSQNN